MKRCESKSLAKALRLSSAKVNNAYAYIWLICMRLCYQIISALSEFMHVTLLYE